MVNAPDNLGTLRRDLTRALAILDDRHDDYVNGREYYDGTHAEVFASKAVRKLVADSAEAVPISLAHIPVDVIADKVELASITAAESAAAEALALVIEANDLEDESDDLIRKACYFGDFYAIIDPIAEDADGNIAAADVKVIGSSPLNTVVVYDPQYQRTPLHGAKVWRDGKRWRALLFYDDATVKLTTEESGDEARPTKGDPFEPDLEGEQSEADLDHYLAHPGGHMLLVHLAIDGKPYGTPIHRKAWGPQDAITKISATNLNNVDAQGFASRWALADSLAEIDDDIDDDFGDAGPDTSGAAPSDGRTAQTDGSRLRTLPGAVNILRGIKSVGQFSNTPTEDFLKNQDWYVRVMAVATGVALFEFDLNGEQPSGESRRRAEGRSNKKAAKIKRQAGAFFAELADTVLGLLGIDDATVTVNFNPSETATDKEGIELVALKIANGVPIPKALLEAGYTDEDVALWFPDNVPHVTPAVLTALAAALAQLGQAKTLGVITDEELRDMLPTILTAARGEATADVDEVEPDSTVVEPAEEHDVTGDLKAQAEALGQLIRSGADPEQAAARVGLAGLTFPNVPVTVRIPEAEATGLEGTGAPAPDAPAAPAGE